MHLLSAFLPLLYRLRVLNLTFKQSSALCSLGQLQTFPFPVIWVAQYSHKDILHFVYLSAMLLKFP